MLDSVALPCLDPRRIMDHHRSDSSYEATRYSQDNILIRNSSKITRQSALIENTNGRNKTTHADFFIKG